MADKKFLGANNKYFPKAQNCEMLSKYKVETGDQFAGKINLNIYIFKLRFSKDIPTFYCRRVA